MLCYIIFTRLSSTIAKCIQLLCKACLIIAEIATAFLNFWLVNEAEIRTVLVLLSTLDEH